MRYEVIGWTKFAEEDVFSQGCIGNSLGHSDNQMRFSADTIEGLVKKLMEFVGTDDRENVELDACDEDGRIDIQVFETEDGCTATAKDIEQWKKGEKRLWLCDYIFHAELVDRKTVALVYRT